MLTWNGEEVTGDISEIVVRDNAGDAADTLTVLFPDPEQAWARWKPEKGDVLVASLDGWNSGAMYFDGNAIANQAYQASAISTPPACRSPVTRAWENARFSQIASDAARACGLTLELHETTDWLYDHVTQDGGNAAFINARAEREGYRLKVHGGKAVIFNEKAFENKPTVAAIDAGDMERNYRFGSGAAILKRSCAVSYYGPSGLISYTHTAPGIYGGDMRLEYRAASVAEAQRYARAGLRAANRDEYAGGFWLPLNMSLAAGATVTLTGLGAFNGLWYLSRIEHYLIGRRTNCLCRRPIKGDY